MDGRTEVDLTLYNPKADEPFALNGRYRLDTIVGHGGMGKIFQATDMVLNRPVVVKILLTEYVQDRTFIERFTREAKILSTINHPHLLVIYDYGIYSHKTPYIVTEYVEGRTLAEIIAGEGRLQVKRAVNLVCQVLDALSATHAHGVIHRDLKAENILVGGASNMEWVKVIDFGLAYQMEHRKITEQQSRITGSGLFVGTLAYMPPEQFMNEDLDARTDIYSVGILMWEMLVGHVPFQAPTLEKFYSKHSTEQVPSFATVTPPLPGQAVGLESVILKALSKRPKDRWKDATEFKMAIRKAEEQTIRESIPYQAYNFKTDRVPTDRVPYPDTDRLKKSNAKLSMRERKGKTSIRVREREPEKSITVSNRVRLVKLFESLSKTASFLISAVLYVIILVLVAFFAYTVYPKVKGILYPPPHVSLNVPTLHFQDDMLQASLVGEAEFCKKLGRVAIETSMVGPDHKILNVANPPNFLIRTTDGTFADFTEISVPTESVQITHVVYLPVDAYLGGDRTKKFCVRVRIFDSKGNLLNTYYTAARQLDLPQASPPVL